MDWTTDDLPIAITWTTGKGRNRKSVPAQIVSRGQGMAGMFVIVELASGRRFRTCLMVGEFNNCRKKNKNPFRFNPSIKLRQTPGK